MQFRASYPWKTAAKFQALFMNTNYLTLVFKRLVGKISIFKIVQIGWKFGQYFKNINGDWIGVVSGLFYFDFYGLREIISFQPLSNLLNKNK